METIPIAFIVAILAIAAWQYIEHRRTMKRLDRMLAESQKRERGAMSGLRTEIKAVSDKAEELYRSLRGES